MVGQIVYVNLGRCIACRACEVACEEAHNGKSFIRVYEFVEDGFAIPINCRHCQKAPCIEVCPVRAITRDGDGAVIISPLKCIGCGLCTIVCPLAIPKIDTLNKVAVKCDLCSERRKQGLPPACIAACPTDAITIVTPEEMYKLEEARVERIRRAYKESLRAEVR